MNRIITPAFVLVGLLFGLATSHGQSWFNNGLLAYYPLDGNANDVSGYGKHLTNNGALFTTNRFGTTSSAAKLTGAASYIAGGGWFTNQTFTISLWVYPNATQTAYACIIDNCHLTGINWVLQQNNTTQNTYYFSSSVFPIPATQWSSIQIVKTLSSLQTFRNGTLISSNAAALITYDGSQMLNLGRYGRTGVLEQDRRYFSGLIDDIRIYNRALSAKEVASLYYYESQKQVQLVKYYNLDFDGLLLGRNYQLQASTNLLLWTNWGSPFTATSDTYSNSIPFQRVDDWSKIFFRLQQE